MKHAVLGMGAIGGLMATALSSIGEEVIAVVRHQKLADYPEQLSLQQPTGAVSGTARSVSKLIEAVDVLWIATKAYHLESSLETIATTPEMVVPLLNGVDHITLLRLRFGPDRVVPSTIAVEANRLEEGRFEQRSVVRLSVAASGERVLAPLLARLQEQLGFVCQFIANEETLLWSKLCFLAPFALVTSASGKNKGEIFADAEWKAKLHAAIAETVAVAKASGAVVEAQKIEALFDSLPDGMRSSMLKDLLAGRQLELDAIAGPIVRGGAQYGISVPTTSELMATVQSRANQAHE